MRIYKESRTGRWYVDYFFRGQRYRYKAGSSKRAAEQLRLRIESEINTGKHSPAAVREDIRGGGKKGDTFGQLVKAFLDSYRSRGETKYYHGKADVWNEFFGEDTPLADITPLRVEAFRNARLKKLSASTVRKDLIALGTMFRWAMAKRLVAENPADCLWVKRPSEPPGREVFLTDKQVDRLLESCPKDVRRLAAWLVESGMRLSEPLKLRWKDLDKRTGWVYVAVGKTGKPRRIPYTPTLQEIAELAPRRLRTELLFCDPDGKPLRMDAMSRQIKAAMIRAKIEDASAHSLRHTFASRLASDGVPMMVIADLLGQNAATTTARYMHLQPEHLKQAMAVLERRRRH